MPQPLPLPVPEATPVQVAGNTTHNIPATPVGDSGYQYRGSFVGVFGQDWDVNLIWERDPAVATPRVSNFDFDSSPDLDWGAYPSFDAAWTRIRELIADGVAELNRQIAAEEGATP